jgi:hypothetical protein
MHEVARMRWCRVPREVRRRADDDESNVTGHGHRDHVAIDDFAELNSSVVPSGNDVRDLVAHREIELNVSMRKTVFPALPNPGVQTSVPSGCARTRPAKDYRSDAVSSNRGPSESPEFLGRAPCITAKIR